MKNLHFVFISTCCLYFLGPGKATAQFVEGVFISVKTGSEAFDKRYVEAFDVGINSSRFILTAGYNFNRDSHILHPIPREHYEQVNLLFGLHHTFSDFRVEYQAGLGVIRGHRRTSKESEGFLVDTYHSKDFSTVGVPVKAGLRYIPLSFMSIGLELQANINSERSLLRPMLSLSLGKFK